MDRAERLIDQRDFAIALSYKELFEAGIHLGLAYVDLLTEKVMEKIRSENIS
jgi:hypothetical protein